MLCFFNNFTNVFHTCAYSTQYVKGPFHFVGDNICNGCFAHPGRPPQDHGRNITGRNRFSDNSVRPYKVFLTYKIFQPGRTQTFSKGAEKLRSAATLH